MVQAGKLRKKEGRGLIITDRRPTMIGGEIFI
jgi:hypothetical protein